MKRTVALCTGGKEKTSSADEPEAVNMVSCI